MSILCPAVNYSLEKLNSRVYTEQSLFVFDLYTSNNIPFSDETLRKRFIKASYSSSFGRYLATEYFS